MYSLCDRNTFVKLDGWMGATTSNGRQLYGPSHWNNMKHKEYIYKVVTNKEGLFFHFDEDTQWYGFTNDIEKAETFDDNLGDDVIQSFVSGIVKSNEIEVRRAKEITTYDFIYEEIFF